MVDGLLMRRRRWMDHQGLRIAHVGKVRRKLDAVDESLSGLRSTLDPERQNASVAVREDSRCNLVIGMVGEAWIVDPYPAASSG